MFGRLLKKIKCECYAHLMILSHSVVESEPFKFLLFLGFLVQNKAKRSINRNADIYNEGRTEFCLSSSHLKAIITAKCQTFGEVSTLQNKIQEHNITTQ